MLTRLRLGHCALNKTLKMIGKHQTGLCEGCQEEESVEHVLRHAPLTHLHGVVVPGEVGILSIFALF